MPSFFPPHSLSNRSNALLLSSRTRGTQARIAPPLNLGEVVRATVLSVKADAGTVTLSVKGQALELHSSHSFRPGEIVTLKVDRSTPDIQFRLAGGADGRSQLPGALAGGIRIYPRLLLNIFKEAETVLRGDAMSTLIRIVGKEDAERLSALLRSLVFTRVEAERGFNFRNYLERFGFFMERQLGMAEGRTLGQGAAAQEAGENLRALFMSIEARLSAFGERAPLSLMNFIGSSLKALETWHVLNSLLGEWDGTFLFQIPLSLAERTELAHILINVGEERKEGKDGPVKKAAVSLFVDLDALGPLAVRADVLEGGIDCLIICEEDETVTFLSPLLGELRSSLEKAGLAAGRIECRLGRARAVEEEGEEVIEKAAREYDTVDVTV